MNMVNTLNGRDIRELAEEFGDLNGWKRTDRDFGLKTLARKTHMTYTRVCGWLDIDRLHHIDGGAHYAFFDHPICFRSGRRAAAIVGQPYPQSASIRDHEDRLIAWLEPMGLTAYAPPKIMRAFHNPGHCAFFVVVPAGEPEPRWLASQCFQGRAAELLG